MHRRIQNLEIEDINEEGRGIGRVNNQVIFVEGAIPKDVVDVLIYKKRRKLWLGRVERYVAHSPYTVVPFCSHFGTCGGCQWQHFDYQQQLNYKQQNVTETLKRLSGLDLPDPYPILSASQQIYYRNKLEFSFTHQRWLTDVEIKSDEDFDRRGLGFHLPKRFDKVLDITTCFLQPPVCNMIRLAIKAFSIEKDLPFFNITQQTGFLRTLTIRVNTQDKLMIILQFYKEHSQRKQLLDFLMERYSSHIASLYYVFNDKKNDTYGDLPLILYAGTPYLEEYIHDLKFHISPKSFFQTNTKQTERLYNVIEEFASSNSNSYVLDLYTGIGTIALSLAKSAKKVIGIDNVAEAIENAEENAQLNNIDNVKFYVGDVQTFLDSNFITEDGKPDIIITDPPRTGMHQTVVEQINYLAPHKIVYVSCNPSTQARDLVILEESYRVKAIQPVDMFPHTRHIENVVMLEKI